MKTDTDRLKVDIEHWRECGAPEDATHLAFYSPGKTWFKTDGEGNIYEWHMRLSEWQEAATLNKIVRLIPRPQSEWVDGLPPKDTECEVMLESGKWEWCKVRAHSGSGSWIVTKSEDRVVRNDLVGWRSIRTNEQRQRDELALSIQNTAEQMTKRAFPDSLAQDMADDILSYSKEKKQ